MSCRWLRRDELLGRFIAEEKFAFEVVVSNTARRPCKLKVMKCICNRIVLFLN